jgi:hypothetical protein
MKKSSSVNLEESTWKEINNYQNKFDLSSRNDALERIIQEWKMLWLFFNKDVVVSAPQNDNNKELLKEEQLYNDAMSNSISDVLNNMPD